MIYAFPTGFYTELNVMKSIGIRTWLTDFTFNPLYHLHMPTLSQVVPAHLPECLSSTHFICLSYVRMCSPTINPSRTSTSLRIDLIHTELVDFFLILPYTGFFLIFTISPNIFWAIQPPYFFRIRVPKSKLIIWTTKVTKQRKWLVQMNKESISYISCHGCRTG